MRIYTVGHGALPWERFLTLLQDHEIAYLIDVRSAPFSRWHPHFSKKNIAPALAAVNIQYSHVGALGGLHEGAGSGPAFLAAIEEVASQAKQVAVALMCGCGKYDDCHRERLLAPVFRAMGHEVAHIIATGGLDMGSPGRALKLPGLL